MAGLNGNGRGMAGLPFGGVPEPFGFPPYVQRLPIVVRPGQGLMPAGAAGVNGGQLPGAEPASFSGPANPYAGKSVEDLPLLEVLKLASQQLVWIQHPSPLDTKPFLGTREQYTQAAVIQPPTSSAAAAATAGGIALQAGYNASTGGEDPATLLTPATPSEFVTVLSFTVPRGRSFLIWSVAGEVHDYLGEANVIRWRVRVGSTLIVPETQLGQLGTPSNQLVVQELATEQQTVYFEARNVDGESASLVGAYLLGWSFPLEGTGNEWSDIINAPDLEREFANAPPPRPARRQLVLAPPGVARYGGASVWTHPDDGQAIWFSGSHPAFASSPQFDGFRMTWDGQRFVVDQWAGPLQSFDPRDMSFEG